MALARRTFSWQVIFLLLVLYFGPASTRSVSPRGEIVVRPKTGEPGSTGGESESNTFGSGKGGEGSSFGQGASESEPYITSETLNNEDSGTRLFSDSDDSETFKKLAEQVSDLLETYASTSTPASTSSSTTSTLAAAMMITPAPTQASLGCKVFHSYTSICFSSMASNSAATAENKDFALASCACYSASYYVPNVLDSAAQACAGYTSASTSANPSTHLNAIATSASKMEHFCSRMGNVRSLSSAQFGKEMASATSNSYGPEITASSHGEKPGAAGMGLWVAVLGSVLLI